MGLVYRALIGGGKQNPPVKPFKSWPRLIAYAPILTAEDIVRRIAAECAYIDERGGVGIRLEPAAAIVRRYGEQFRRLPRRRQTRGILKPPPLL